MLVLGIESTCDETAAAVVVDGKEVLSNVIASQVDWHKEFGGVVPELASRQHIEAIIPVVMQSLEEAGCQLSDIDVIAAADRPGLMGSLLVGINTAKALAWALGKPYVGVNHLEAHLYAVLMEEHVPTPALGVILSGGHTQIMHIPEFGVYHQISKTVDDAIGEAFDKVAKMLELPYPGGPEIERLAKQGDPTAFQFRAGRVKGQPLAFSFSGLKTAVLYQLRKLETDQKADVAASFQRAAFDDVLKKISLAAKEYECDRILLGGGVTNSRTLRAQFAKQCPHLHPYWPAFGLSLDNGAMIAGLAYHQIT